MICIVQWSNPRNTGLGGLPGERPPRQAQSFRPEGTRMVRQFHHFADGRNEFCDLRRSDHQRRSDFQYHEVIPANLGEDPAIAKQAHDKNLSKHCRMDLRKCLERYSQSESRWSLELNSEQESFAPDILYHLATGERLIDPLLQFCALLDRALAKLLAL